MKCIRADRDTLEQWEDLSGVVVRHEPDEKYESYFISWEDFPGEVMMRDELAPLTEDEKLVRLASQVMQS